MASVIAGTVIKYMLAEFNSSQPEVYAHHKAVRDLIADESMRDYTFTDIDNCSSDWVIDTPITTSPVRALCHFINFPHMAFLHSYYYKDFCWKSIRSLC